MCFGKANILLPVLEMRRMRPRKNNLPNIYSWYEAESQVSLITHKGCSFCSSLISQKLLKVGFIFMWRWKKLRFRGGSVSGPKVQCQQLVSDCKTYITSQATVEKRKQRKSRWLLWVELCYCESLHSSVLASQNFGMWHIL